MLSYDLDAITILDSIISPQEMAELRIELAAIIENDNRGPISPREARSVGLAGIVFDRSVNIARIYTRLNTFDFIPKNSKIAMALNKIASFSKNDPHLLAILSFLFLHTLLCNPDGTLQNKITETFFPHGIQLAPGSKGEKISINFFIKHLYYRFSANIIGCHATNSEIPVQNHRFMGFIINIFQQLDGFNLQMPHFRFADREYLLRAFDFIKNDIYTEDHDNVKTVSIGINKTLREPRKWSLVHYFQKHYTSGNAIAISGAMAITIAIGAAMLLGGPMSTILLCIFGMGYIIAYITMLIKASCCVYHYPLLPPLLQETTPRPSLQTRYHDAEFRRSQNPDNESRPLPTASKRRTRSLSPKPKVPTLNLAAVGEPT